MIRIFQIYLLTIAMVVVTTATIYAQSGKLKGTVKDSIGKTVESANVLIQDTKLITSAIEWKLSDEKHSSQKLLQPLFVICIN